MARLTNEEYNEFVTWQAQNRLLDEAYTGMSGLDADLKDYQRFKAYKEQQKQNPYTPTDINAVARRVMELSQNR